MRPIERAVQMPDSFWLDRALGKTRPPYPATFAVLNLLLYTVGLATAAVAGNLGLFLAEPRWILINLFGFVNGTAITYAVRGFDSALSNARSLSTLTDDDFQQMRVKLSRLMTSKFYWLLVAGWLLFSFTHIVLLRQPAWWTRDGYNLPLVIDVLGFLIQGWNGCVLGGMFMFIVPIGLNLAYWRICRPGFFRPEVATPAGTKALSSFARLITGCTLAAVILSALAISIWAQIPSRYVVYIPLVGSAFMFLPTAIIPHYLFHGAVSRARKQRLEAIAAEIQALGTDQGEPSIRDLVALHKLLREEIKTEKGRNWLVDVRTAIELLLVAVVHYLMSVVLRLLHIGH
jgi:hypothetical protein